MALLSIAVLSTPIPAPGPQNYTNGSLVVHNDSCFRPPALHPYPRFAPRYHIGDSCQGENDPCGSFYFRGTYHVFYQDHTQGGTSGGHAVSTDLVTWRELMPALWPAEWFAENGVWDFSTTVVDGVPTIVAAGLTDHSTTHFCHVHAVPKDLDDPNLEDWVWVGEPVCGTKENGLRPGDSPSNTWRTSTGEFRYVDAFGNVWSSFDFKHFQLASNASEGGKSTSFPVGCCGDLYTLPRVCAGCEGAYVGASSPAQPTHVWMWWPAGTPGIYELVIYHEGAVNSSGVKEVLTLGVPELSLNASWFDTAGAGWTFDGGGFYASKSFYDPVHDRRIITGWLYPDVLAPGPRQAPGILYKYDIQSLLREVRYDPRLRQLTSFPIGELSELRVVPPLGGLTAPLALGPTRNHTLVSSGANQTEIRIRISPVPTAPTRLGVVVMTGGSSEGIELYVDVVMPKAGAKVQRVHAASDRTLLGVRGEPRSGAWPLLAQDDAIDVAIFIDQTWVEWFVQGGRWAQAVAVPPAALNGSGVGGRVGARHGIMLFANASVVVAEASAWSLRSIWRNPTTHDRPGPA